MDENYFCKCFYVDGIFCVLLRRSTEFLSKICYAAFPAYEYEPESILSYSCSSFERLFVDLFSFVFQFQALELLVRRATPFAPACRSCQ